MLGLDVRITEARDGFDALKIIDGLGSQPDVIFLDINMPVMDGFDFLEKYAVSINAKPSDVVLLTSSSVKDDIQKAREYSFVKEYILKPLSHEKLTFWLEKYAA